MVKVCNDKKGEDKWYHRFVTFVIAVIAGAILASLPIGIASWGKALISFAVAIAVGVWKEWRDYKSAGNHFCVWDLLADFSGAVVGSLFAWLCAWGATHNIAGNLI